MDDSTAGWHNQEIVQSTLTPLEERESLSIATELKFFVFFSCISSTCNINLDGVVDDEVSWAERVNLLGVTT